MYGVDPKSLSGTEWELTLQDAYNSVLEWVKELQDIENLVNQQVNDNLTQARARMKAEYDRGKKDTISKTGDWVYVRNQRRCGLSPPSTDIQLEPTTQEIRVHRLYFVGPYPDYRGGVRTSSSDSGMGEKRLYT